MVGQAANEYGLTVGQATIRRLGESSNKPSMNTTCRSDKHQFVDWLNGRTRKAYNEDLIDMDCRSDKQQFVDWVNGRTSRQCIRIVARTSKTQVSNAMCSDVQVQV